METSRLPPRPRRGPFASAWAPGALGAAWLLALFAPLLPPGRAMANRDIALFHLPLRASFRALAAFGLPGWNPWLHGGQPVLSNPSYGSFYPLSWLIFAAPPHYALSLMAIAHAAIAFAGGWKLARTFGCGRGVAGLAAVGLVGCGVYFSLLSAFNLFWGITWFPWVLAWGEEALRGATGGRWAGPALLSGGALGLALLNGEPATALMCGLGLLALAVAAGWRQPAVLARVGVPFAFAAGLAAVQILPTLARLADSPRGALPAWHSLLWSMPPRRLGEVIFPHLFGDPARSSAGLFFGAFNDGGSPYLESLYPGLLLAVLGVASLLRRGIPRRGAWTFAVLGGGFLALGRYNPLYPGLRRVVPVLAVLRYPEKFAILAVLALVLAGALGWQRLLDEREAGRPRAAKLPLTLALLAATAAAALALLLAAAPAVAARLLGIPPPGAAGLSYLRGESAVALAAALAVAALLAACRWSRAPRRLLSGAALLLLAADLWHAGHRLLRTTDAGLYRVPPRLVASLPPARDRIFVPFEGARGSTFEQLARLTPYGAVIWRVPYAFSLDFDLMLTGWAQRSFAILQEEWRDPAARYRYLGAWNVRTLLVPRTLVPDGPTAGPEPYLSDLALLSSPQVLPRFRFVPRVVFHTTAAEALAAARAGEWDVAREEHAVASGQGGKELAWKGPTRLLDLRDEGARVVLRYRAEEGGFFVDASTFDEGWRARVDGEPVPVFVTAACQLGVVLPAGEHRLELEYRDPFVPVGGAVSLAALLVAFLIARHGRHPADLIEDRPGEAP